MLGGENHGRLYLLFVVVVASAADWQLLRVCECERAREKETASKREGSKKRASRKSRHTNIHTAANLIKNIK